MHGGGAGRGVRGTAAGSDRRGGGGHAVVLVLRDGLLLLALAVLPLAAERVLFARVPARVVLARPDADGAWQRAVTRPSTRRTSSRRRLRPRCRSGARGSARPRSR